MKTKKLNYYLAGVVFFGGILLLLAFTRPPDMPVEISYSDCSSDNTSFKNGEELVFTVYYNWKFVWVPAGEAKFTVRETPTTYDITVIGRTFESYDYFFRVNDYFHSKIDKKTLYPINFVRVVEEGDYRLFDSISFDQKNNIATSFQGKTRDKAVATKHSLTNCMHDLLSVLYFLRNTDVDGYKKGDFLDTDVLFDKELYPIKVRYMGKEKGKKIKELGKFNTIRVIPDVIAGNIFNEDDKMNVWVSDDNNRIPLLVESPLKVGSGKAILTRYSGLRSVVTSKN